MHPARTLTTASLCVLAILSCAPSLNAQNATFQASPSQLVFNVPQTGVMPAQSSAQLSISGPAGSAVQFSTSAPTWLSLTPASGIVSGAAATVTVTLTSTVLGLSPAAYTGIILVSQTGGSPTLQPLAIPVTLNVGNQLSISPSNAINLAYQIGQAPPSVTINVTSTIGSLPYSITSIQPAQSWLLPSVTPGASTPGVVNVSINPTGLASGYYNGSFRISSPTTGVSAQDVTVNLTVSDSPLLTASPQQLSFVYQTGTTTGALPSRTISLATNGGQIGFSVDPSPQSWLSIVTNGTVASQAQPAALTVTVNPNSPFALATGNYTANIVIRPVGGGSSLTIPVALFVSSKALLSIAALPVPFNYQVNGAIPADQTLVISSSSTPMMMQPSTRSCASHSAPSARPLTKVPSSPTSE